MSKKNFLRLILIFVCILITQTLAFSQNSDLTDIPKLLSEVKYNSDENWRKVIAERLNYTYKFRRIWREADKRNQVKEKSETYEFFIPNRCPVKKCRAIFILLAKDGKTVAAEKIEKQRAKASEKLRDMETDAQAQNLTANQSERLIWMRFGYYVRPSSSDEYRTVVLLDGQEILEKCEFYAPSRETINGRETIGLSFRPRADAVFSEDTKYMSQSEGKIWIDKQDKVLIQLAVWQKNTKFAKATSDYLFERAALARSMTRTNEGIWFDHLGRINGLDYPNLFTEMKSDYSLENFDYRFQNTEIKTVEINTPKEKK